MHKAMAKQLEHSVVNLFSSHKHQVNQIKSKQKNEHSREDRDREKENQNNVEIDFRFLCALCSIISTDLIGRIMHSMRTV